MAESSEEIIRRYLQDAIAAEKATESQFRSSASDGDDGEIQALFTWSASKSATQSAQLSERLQSMGGAPSTAKGLLANLFTSMPRTLQINHRPEERLVQNLMMGYAGAMSHRAMYTALGTASNLAGDAKTAALAEALAVDESDVAVKLWECLPSRSKVAFNVLTAGEVDPAIETRSPDGRLH